MYKVSIEDTSARVPVDVSKVADLEQAISFGFQLHQASTCKHVIVVADDRETLATFVRKDTFTLPAPQQDSQQDQKKSFGLRKRNG